MRIPLPTVMLVGINLALAAFIGGRLLHGSEKAMLLNAQPVQMADEALEVGTPDARHDIESIQANAVFYTSRNFYVAPPPTISQEPPPDYRVTGSMSIPNKPLTVLLTHNQSGTRASVSMGGELEGWTVTRISPQTVVIERDGRTVELGAGSARAASANGMTLVGSGAAAVNLAAPIPGGMVRVLGDGRSHGVRPVQPVRAPAPDSARLYRPPSG